MAPLALGSDTGGSIRQPAALCGIVGLKPTYGRVSRYGLLAFASSLDQIGPLTRTVDDAALALSVIAGADPADATSAPEPVPDYSRQLDRRRPRTRGSACRRRLLDNGVDAEVSARVRTRARCAGRTRRDARRHRAAARRAAIPVYYLVATAEASSNLARYDGVRYGFRAHSRRSGRRDDLRTMYARTRARGFGAEVKRRIMLGTYVLSAGYYDAYYLKAQQVRTLIRRDYEQRLRARGRGRDADEPDAGVQDRRTRRRSAADVPGRRLHGQRQPRRPAGGQRAVRVHDGRPADRAAAHRPAVRRGHDCCASPTPTSAIPTGRGGSRSADCTCRNQTGRRGRDEQLLAVRMCDLGLSIAGTELEQRIGHVNAELDARGLARPHYWLSDEWFTPDGVPGVAIPFYLAHPRLAKLELAQMLEVEGGDPESCLMILRHEAGHAIDNAYQLRRRPTRRRLFGNPAHAVPRVLHAEAIQQELRAASRSLVRAEPSRRGLRRNLRRVARPGSRCGRPATPGGRRSASSNTWTG